MTYSNLTFKDKNPIKRWLQSRRLIAATQLANGMSPECILDFGAGNGELCKLIALQFPKAKIVCYEPTPYLMAEAKENLAEFSQIHFVTDVTQMIDSSVSIIFCLEVFEHLPEVETEVALGQFERLLTSDGNVVIGVPIEIGIPALYKGIFRMLRRFGNFDASFKNVLLAALYSPPADRPVTEIAPGFAFHAEHMGFDYRKLQAALQKRFSVQSVKTSPFSFFGTFLNPEANFLLQKSGSIINTEAI
jgi:SAM-dependent methyltransferase